MIPSPLTPRSIGHRHTARSRAYSSASYVTGEMEPSGESVFSNSTTNSINIPVPHALLFLGHTSRVPTSCLHQAHLAWHALPAPLAAVVYGIISPSITCCYLFHMDEQSRQLALLSHCLLLLSPVSLWIWPGPRQDHFQWADWS